jgi:hypothetical protein
MTLPAFKISLSDGSSYITSMAAGISLEAARAYFLGHWFTQSDEVTQLQAVQVEIAA